MRLIYRQHAIKRMFERCITRNDIVEALSNGRKIEEYPNDTPFPSYLWLGFSGNRPIHVVVADNLEDDERIIITVYEPNTAQWDNKFTERLKS